MPTMQYRKPVTIGVAIVAVAAAFWGFDQWNLRKAMESVWPELDGGVYDAPVIVDGEAYLVPGNDIYETDLGVDGIPALNNPAFVSVAQADDVIADDLLGVDIEVGGEHWYFPVQIMNWHEIVNGTFGGKELAVTYCPLCGSQAVFERSVNGESVTFGTSGKVYNNTTLMYDSGSDSLWIQATGVAVTGDRIGTTLAAYPSTMMKWSVWKDEYPTGSVLSTDTGFVRDYTRHPYGAYDKYAGSYFPVNHADASLSTKWLVTWLGDDASSIAFAHDVIKGKGVQQATLRDKTLVGFYDFDEVVTRVFNATVDGETFTFTYDWEDEEIRDEQTGSRWNAEGLAISGRMRGTQLEEQSTSMAYWFCYIAHHPNGSAVDVTKVEGEVPDPNQIEIDVGF